MKKYLIEHHGARIGKNGVLNIKRDKNSLGTMRIPKHRNVWVKSGKAYDFIFIRVQDLKGDEIKTLIKILKLNGLPARNPLRRALVRAMIRDEITMDDFNSLIKKPVKKVKKVKPVNKVPISDEELCDQIMAQVNGLSEKEIEQRTRRGWLRKSYKRMNASIPSWINKVTIGDYTSFDQFDPEDKNHPGYYRTKNGRGRYRFLSEKEFKRIQEFLKQKRFIKGIFVKTRRTGNVIRPVLYVMDNADDCCVPFV